MSDPLWFKDAIIYELHVKTFQDSDGDGVGDFRGLISRLDYLAELGVTALWLLPFYPSPLRDDGYDIADYFAVHPSYGTLEDFLLFLEEAHQRGLRVITELVLNHTSDQCAWFQRARRAPPGSMERNYYVWGEDPGRYREARIIFKDFETSNWTWDPVAGAYFWHRFYSHQPDLNFENPQVREELLRVMDFWLEMGVDGLRLDAVPYLYEAEETNCENLPQTHAFLRQLRRHIDGKFSGRMLLAEANQWPEEAAAYFGQGDECHMEFHFPLMPRMFMALQMEDRYPVVDILEQTPPIPEGCQWATFLRNHDELTLEMVTDEERDYMYRVYALDPRARINLGIRRRLAPLLANNRRKIELINALLYSLPGTPIVYYGDEIGMGDNFYLGDRNGVRTPMQWSADRNAGFSKATPQQLYLPLIIDPDYHYESVNVENQQRSPFSLYWWMRRMLAVRQRMGAFGRGSLEFLHPDNAKVLAYLRRDGGETVLVVANLSRFAQVAELDLSEHAGRVPEELFGRSWFPVLRAGLTAFTLGPHGFYWLALRANVRAQGVLREDGPPVLAMARPWGSAFLRCLEREVLPDYLPTCCWFGGEGRGLREVHVIRQMALGEGADSGRLLLVEASFAEGAPEVSLVVLALAEERGAEEPAWKDPPRVLARLHGGGVVVEGMDLPWVRMELLRHMVFAGMHRSGLVAFTSEPLDPGQWECAVGGHQLLPGSHSNTSLSVGERWHFKLLRRFERGPHPEVELGRFLAQERSFRGAAPFAGALEWSLPEGPGVIGILSSRVQHQGDGWTLTMDALARFFERVLAERVEWSAAMAGELIGEVYPARARQLGHLTGELHVALAGAREDPGFLPEAFTTLYQRSLYQALRGAGGRILRQLRVELPRLAPEAKVDAGLVLAGRGRLLASYAGLLAGKLRAAKMRIHGDFHLGQVLNTGKDFVIVDFEGDASRPLGERRLKRSPLVDVAGMLHSFEAAADAASRQLAPADQGRVEAWTRSWVRLVWARYLGGYLDAVRGAPFLPLTSAHGRLLLEVFLLDRALERVRATLVRRPERLMQALRTVLRMLEAPGAGLEIWAHVEEAGPARD